MGSRTMGKQTTMRWMRALQVAVAVGALGAASMAQAAGCTNLLTAGGVCTDTYNGSTATYTQVAPQPTGTGYIDSFVRIGMPGGGPGNTVMEAYNTTANVLNNSNDDTFNHEITFGQVGLLTVGGQTFMRFLLDINQTSANPKLNLDDVQIFISTSANQSVTTFSGSGVLGLTNSQLVYRLDGNGLPAADDKITLDYSLNSGSGSGDMTLDIPIALFNAAFTAGGSAYDTTAEKNGAFIYLYSKFGSMPFTNNDGFEEWTYVKGSPIGGPGCTKPGGCAVPEPGSVSLFGFALLGLAVLSRRRKGEWVFSAPRLAH
jgi:PEP-CTERM motif